MYEYPQAAFMPEVFLYQTMYREEVSYGKGKNEYQSR